MGIKNKLILGTAAAILGLSLVGAPTYAFFWGGNNTASAAEDIDLNTNTRTIIDVANLKPGDTMTRSFSLRNDGSADIRRVALGTNYTVNDAKDNNVEDFGKHIRVNFMWNQDKSLMKKWSPDKIIYQTTLYDLQKMTPDAVDNKVFIPFFEEQGGLRAGDSDKLHVQFEFVDKKQEQNVFQSDELQLSWTFEGEAK